MLLNSLKQDIQKLRDKIEKEGPPKLREENDEKLLSAKTEKLNKENSKGGSLAGLKKQL